MIAQNLSHEGVRCHHQVWNSALYVQTQRMMGTTQSSKSTSSLVYLLCIVSCFVVRVVPVVVCDDDAVVRRTLVLIAVAVAFVFVVAIFHRILLYWRYIVYNGLFANL